MRTNLYRNNKKKLTIFFLSLCMVMNVYGLDKVQFEKLTEKNLILDEYVEVLHSLDRNTLLSFFPQVEKRYYSIDEHSENIIEYTWTDLPYNFDIYFFSKKTKDFDYSLKDIYEISLGDNDFDEFEIIEMEIKNSELLFSVMNTRNRIFSDSLIDIPNFVSSELYSFLFVFDGDYVSFYIDDIFIHRFCCVEEEFIKQYKNLIESNNCDLSKVTWPRHADGTSEYDDKIIIPEQIVLFENEKTNNTSLESSLKKEEIITEEVQDAELRTVIVKKNTEMVIVENSILRLDPDPNGAYMNSVVKGTKVKIKKIGKKATINGITSKWVLINFIGDAYNSKGEKIYYKTEGWLFGGCLE